MNGNCLNNWCLVLPINKLELSREMISGTVSIGIVVRIVLTGCLPFGLAWKIDAWCLKLIRFIQTNDLGTCLLIGIVLKIVFTGYVWIGMASTIDFGWCTRIEIDETTAFGDRPKPGLYPNNRILEGSAIWKPADTALGNTIVWFSEYRVHY